MKKLHYSIDINASAMHVWETMIDPDHYQKWAQAFSPHAQFSGIWKEGEYIDFIDPGMGGTRAVLEVFDPYTSMRAKHVAMISHDGAIDDKSTVARQWIGTIEEYIFTQNALTTTLEVHMTTHENFVDMFDNTWPEALELLRDLCEK